MNHDQSYLPLDYPLNSKTVASYGSCLPSTECSLSMVLSSFWVFMGSSVFECSSSSAILLGASNFLWLELSWRLKVGL